VIRLIQGMPSNVVGIEAVGEVRAGDYAEVLDPAVDSALGANDTIRLLYVLGTEFTGYSGGAMWEDTKLGVSHWSRWDRIALVTDDTKLENAVKAFGWMLPCEVKIFGLDALYAAEAWVSE
jgi:hypothetical protein